MVSLGEITRKVVHAPIVRVGNEEAWRPEHVVSLAVRYLSGSCDGARKPDGVGFNRLDATFGNHLANLPIDEWTPRQLHGARRMISKYENTQLRFLKDKLPDIPDERSALALIRDGKPLRQLQARTPIHHRTIQMAEIDGQTNVLIFHERSDDAPSRMLYQIREIPGIRWDYDRQCRRAIVSAETLTPIADLIHGWSFSISDDDADRLTGLVDRYAAFVEMSHAKDADIIIPGFGNEFLQPFPFQRAGIRFAMHVLSELDQQGFLVADEMGLGKTIQGLGIIKLLDLFPFVVICPASLKNNWCREARTWIGGSRIAHCGRQVFSLTFMGFESLCDGAVVNYNVQTLRKWKSELVTLKPKAIILDEMHNLKNGSAQQTKEVQEIIELTGAKVIGLSGTPVVNRPAEFWQLAEILGQHDKLAPTFSKYMEQYGTNDERRLHQLNLAARQHFMVRRLKKDVLPDLPPKLRDAVVLDLDNWDEYDQTEADIADYFATKKSESEAFEKKVREAWDDLTRHVQEEPITLTWDQFLHRAKVEQYGISYAIASANEELLRWEALKSVAVKGKLKAAFDWIDTFLDSTDEKIVLFIWHNDVGKQVASRYGCDLINGDMPVDRRQSAVDRFQNDPTARVICGNLQAMGEGLTLTAASTVAFLELGWNPKQMGQAEDRCHRIGQKDTVNVHWLVAENTIEDEIAGIIQSKMRIVDAIQDGAGGAEQKDVMSELKSKLSSKRKAA